MLSGVFLIVVSGVLVAVGTRTRREEQKTETMTTSEAKLFPVFGSAALLGIFFAIKYVPKKILDRVLCALFAVTGTLSVYKIQLMAYEEIKEMVTKKSMSKNTDKTADKKEGKQGKKSKTEDSSTETQEKEKSKEDRDVHADTDTKNKHAESSAEKEAEHKNKRGHKIVQEIEKSAREAKMMLTEVLEHVMRVPNIFMFSTAVVVNAIYFRQKDAITSNIIASCFALTGMQEIRPESTQTVLVLLCLLFFYDIFWVFCTPVMIGVAKGVDLPIKIVSQYRKGSASMIGLGDIVIPGLYLSVAKEFANKKGAPWVYRMGYAGYVLSLIVTFAVVMMYKRGQPALLYICPIIVSTSMLGALWHRKTREYIQYVQE